MRKQIKSSVFGIVGGVFLFITQTPMVVASGSFGNAEYNNNWQVDYDKGKKIFQEKVVCDSCPFSNMEMDDDNIQSMLPELERSGQIGQYLSHRDRESVKLYVKKRFNI